MKDKDWSLRRGKELVLRQDDLMNLLTATPTIEQLIIKIRSHSPRCGNPKKGGTGVLESEKFSFTIDNSPHFVVSGQTKLIDTPVKSIENDSEIKNLPKETSEKSPQSESQTMTSLQQVSHARVFPLRENVKVSKTLQGGLFSGKFVESYEVKDQNMYSLRMLKDYFLTTKEKPSQSYSFHWMNLGTMQNGRCVTQNISCPKTVKGSLSSVLEDEVDEKYYLSEEQINKIQNHIKDNKEGNVADFRNDEGLRIRGENISPTLMAVKNSETELSMMMPIVNKIRRLTPVECERLQGFLDDWTSRGIDKDENEVNISDTQRYKMCGNAVSTPVITAIGERILDVIK